MAIDQRLAVGSQLGSYTIIRLIERGGMGEVYEAYETLLDRRVALKIISKEIAEDEENIRLFITEGKALAQLNHPNVVSIYNLGQDNDIYFIAMEYIEGDSLQTHIRQNNLKIDLTLHIFRQVLEGTAALHSKGIIHRDLKPRNIVIDKNNNAKIVDFGIAKIMRQSMNNTNPGAGAAGPVGSPHYMAPEVIEGESATFQSDIWSLGIIFYEMLTGLRPFIGSTRQEVMQKITSQALKFSLAQKLLVPKKLQEIVLKMCATYLKDRYSEINQILNEIITYQLEQNPDQTAKLLSASQTGRMLSATQTNTFIGATAQTSKMTAANGNTMTMKIAQSKKSNRRSKRKRNFIVSNSNIQNIALAAAALFFAYFLFVKYFKTKPRTNSITVVEPNATTDLASNSTNEAAPEIPESNSEANGQQVNQPPVQVQANTVSQEVQEHTIPQTQTINNPKTQAAAPPTQNNQAPLEKSSLKTNNTTSQNKRAPFILQFKKGRKSRHANSTSKLEIANPPEVEWTKVRYAKSYQLQISNTRNFSKTILVKNVATNKFAWGDARPGTFYWRVRARYKNKKLSSVIEANTLQIALPSPQFKKLNFDVAISGTNQASNNRPVQFELSWHPIPLAKHYTVNLYRDQNLSQKISTSSVLTTHAILRAQPTGRYYAVVHATNTERVAISANSQVAVIRFYNNVKLAAPNAFLPQPGQRLDVASAARPINIQWNAISGAQAYQIQFSRDQNFRQIFFQTQSRTNSYKISMSPSVGRYYWRVRSIRNTYESNDQDNLDDDNSSATESRHPATDEDKSVQISPWSRTSFFDLK